MDTIDSFPIKTRVPLAAWIFAGFLTLLSTVSSTVQHIAISSSDGVVSASASEHTISKMLRSSLY
jgi:predicted RND superfamily exporter protein